MSETDKTLDPAETATFLNIQPRTLESWRARRIGPPWIRYSKTCVRYRVSDLVAWQESRRTVVTNDAA